MFFTAMKPLLATCASLNVYLVQNEDGTITVSVLPILKKDGENQNSLKTPLSLTALAEELDTDFVGLISNFSNKRQTLAEQLEATEAIMDAAKKDSASKATTAVKKGAAKSAKSESPSADDDDSVDEEGNPKIVAGAAAVALPAAKPGDNIWEG